MARTSEYVIWNGTPTREIGYVRTPWEHWLCMWSVIGWHVVHDSSFPRPWGCTRSTTVPARRTGTGRAPR